MSSDVWTWVAAALIIGVYSVLFKDNPIYRILECVFVGMMVGYEIVVNWFNFMLPTLATRVGVEKEFLLLIPLLTAGLMYFRYSRRYAWIARYSMGFLMGIGAAYVLTKDLKPFFLMQARATMLPLWVPHDLPATINNWVIVFGVMSVLIYFFFTVEKKGAIRLFGMAGRYVLMVAFGAAFGNTVMGRVTVTLQQFQFLLSDWLGLVSW